MSDIAGPGYVFYPVMLMMFAFAVVVGGPGEFLVRLVIWLVAASTTRTTPPHAATADPLAAAELGDTVLAAQAFQYNADFVFRREVAASRDGPSSRLLSPVLSPARISVSSSLLGGLR
jgi:hypothetical protein